MFDVKEAEEAEKRKKDCKGKVYRGRKNAFVNKKGEYVYQERMYFLKKKSCPGCEYCGFLDDYLQEFMGSNVLPIIDDIENNALYSLQVVNMIKDFETGIVDEFDLEFVRIV